MNNAKNNNIVQTSIGVRRKFALLITSALLLSACGGGGGGGAGAGAATDIGGTVQSTDVTIAAGEKETYQLPMVAGRNYHVEITEKNCTSDVCCELSAYTDIEPLTLSSTFAVAGSDGVARLTLDSAVNSTLNVQVQGVTACTYSPPVTTYTLTASSAANISAPGQLVTHTIAVTKTTDVDDAQFTQLKDFSRRSNGLANWASIETNQFIPNLSNRADYFITPHMVPTNQSFSIAAVDAHAHSAMTYDYLKGTLGLNSYDNKGSTMYAVTDLDFPVTPTKFCDRLVQPGTLWNAFWNGSSIAFTQKLDRPAALSAALDVVAHEWGHAVTDTYTSMTYARESGALNEAFSDWIGVAVKQSQGSVDWGVGGDVIALRSIEAPLVYGDPDTYGGTNWQNTDITSCPDPDICENDYCGVHSNSGVPNKMFYLLAVGGTHNGVTVTGIGIDNAMKIALAAMQNYWTENETFASAKQGMISAATDIDTDQVVQVKLAWDAVGVN